MNTPYIFPGGQTLSVIQADLTTQQVDVMVNAANSELEHGGGVALAIVRKGGEVIQEESHAWIRKYGRVSHGQPAWTGAGSLPCRWVIHAVGPVWGSGDEDRKLSDAIRGSLEVAEKLEARSIAFPPISTGIYRFPRDHAAGIFFKAIANYYQAQPASNLHDLRIAIIDRETYDVFCAEFKHWQEEA